MDQTLYTDTPHIHPHPGTLLRVYGWVGARECGLSSWAKGHWRTKPSHTFAPCDLPLSAEQSLRGMREWIEIEARYTERGVRVQEHNYFMRPVVSAQHLKATGLMKIKPLGWKWLDSYYSEADAHDTCDTDVYACTNLWCFYVHAWLLLHAWYTKSVATICNERRPLTS